MNAAAGALAASAAAPDARTPAHTGRLLHLAARLAHPADRAAAAAALAAALGAEELLIFVRDPEVGALLPAPGFPQTLPDGQAWRAFLSATVGKGRHAGALPAGGDVACRPAVGIAAGADAVAVLLGAATLSSAATDFHHLLPLVAAALANEQLAATTAVQVDIARDAMARATALSAALDAARGELQQALHRARDATHELEAANRAKSEFLAAMSHELRTPLNAIAGHVQLVEMGVHGPITAAQAGALGRVQRSQQHLLSLINDILNFAKLDAGRVEYRMEAVALAGLVAELIAMMEPQLAAKEMIHEVRIAPELVVRADSEKLQQIVLNLLSNAIKFTSRGGRITVDAVAHARAVAGERLGVVFLRVSDTGPGIPRSEQESIFEPFVQVHREPAGLREGTGLGLAISRELARGMGGDLRVRSEVGEGSTFTLTLPGMETVGRAQG